MINLKPKFKAHGYCEIETHNNTMFITAYGPWNDEYFDRLHIQLASASQHIDPDNFVVYLEPIGEAIPTTTGAQKHKVFLQQSKVKAVAINLTSCETKFMTKELCHQIYQANDITHQFFSEKGQALAWLEGFLSK